MYNSIENNSKKWIEIQRRSKKVYEKGIKKIQKARQGG